MSVQLTLRRNVAVLSLTNPPVNGLSHGVRKGLVDGIEKAHGIPGVKACVLVGGGRTWPAGADITEVCVRVRACACVCVRVRACAYMCVCARVCVCKST